GGVFGLRPFFLGTRDHEKHGRHEKAARPRGLFLARESTQMDANVRSRGRRLQPALLCGGNRVRRTKDQRPRTRDRIEKPRKTRNTRKRGEAVNGSRQLPLPTFDS